jgi:hypothetical protein
MCAARPPDSYPIGYREHSILLFLNTYHLLTAVQVAKLLDYASTSLELVQRRLKRLCQSSFVQAERMHGLTGFGSTPLLYSLATRGWKYLRQSGIDVEERLRGSEALAGGWLFQAHSVAVNDVLINAACLPRHDGRVELAELRHERELKRLKIAVSVRRSQGQELRGHPIHPDGFLRFRLSVGGAAVEQPIILEADRGTEGQAAWRRKVTGLVQFLQTQYERQFGSPVLPTIAVVATPGQARAEELRRWTEAECKQEWSPSWGGLFCFTAAPPEKTFPQRFWSSPVWNEAFGTAPVPLLDLEHGTVRSVVPWYSSFLN